jgi:hypothetical protein
MTSHAKPSTLGPSDFSKPENGMRRGIYVNVAKNFLPISKHQTTHYDPMQHKIKVTSGSRSPKSSGTPFARKRHPLAAAKNPAVSQPK